jgi:hypothetical protein
MLRNVLCSRLRCMLYEIYDPYLCQGQGPLTYAGRKRSTTEHHHRGKQVLDIHLLKAELLAALPLELPASLSGQPGMDADDAATPEWVTYAFSTAHPILRLRWLPLKLAVWCKLGGKHAGRACDTRKTGCYVYCPATQQHSCQQSGAQQGWGASEDVHYSTMGE